MGVYIHKLSKKPEITTEEGGIHVYAFYQKAAGPHDYELQDRQGDRCARYNKDFPHKENLMVVTHKAEGVPVYLQEKVRPIFLDNKEPEGTVIGTLTKKGRSWTLAPL